MNPELKMEAVVARAPNDTEMLAAFRDALAVDSRISHNRYIDSRCRNGMIFLSGTVGSREEKHLTLSAARATAGVIRVVDRLRVDETPVDQELGRAPTTPLALGENR